MRPSLVLLLGLLILALPGLAQDKDKAPAGFTPLFDGKTLEGWKFVNCEGNFLANEGHLVMNKGAGWLATEKTFGDFELRIKYRFITAGADSGIFIRSGLEGKNWTSKGYQIQNMDNQTLGQVIGMGLPVKAKSHQPDLVKEIKKPAGEWNDLVIVAKGADVTVTLNGKQVASGEIVTEPGHIGLQAEGGVLEFERIDIKAL
jgi:hypothetical protein